MQTIKKIISATLPYQFLPNKSIAERDILFFDIETTGFSPDISSIYLIGCCYYENGTWNLIQYFADDYISEQNILQHFIDFSGNYNVMIHFNGSGFDIPYLQKKLLHYNMSFSFDSFLQVDLYKKIFPYKKLLGLPNLKQKTVEDFLKLPRKDMYSGKELIEVYVQYMKDKFGHKASLQKEQNLLLLHNEEDVANLIRLTSILAYSDLLEETPTSYSFTKEEHLFRLEYFLRNPILNPITLSLPEITFSVADNIVHLDIPCITCELKYFYPNYKDYYYLPMEDTALHKSVAGFVDKKHRQKAKASNCYSKKTGVFLPQFHGSLEPAFQENYKDKRRFIELNDRFLSNSEMCQKYISILLQHLSQTLKKK